MITEKVGKLLTIKDDKKLEDAIDKLTDNEKKIMIKGAIKFMQEHFSSVEDRLK
ncbi:MAG: hypothetical protein PUK21_03975 [Peptostreptococcaceae bacterium]|nr:hypothetical protein [Peptostreptococcaceae bacterium]MDY5739401.1 hypothetical protein [Anaerovoracaceae bacterium]